MEGIAGRVACVLEQSDDEMLGHGYYGRLRKENQRIVYLSSKDIRRSQDEAYDRETAPEAMEQSVLRDLRLVRFLSVQGVDLVYSMPFLSEKIRERIRQILPQADIVLPKDSCEPMAGSIESHQPGTLYWLTGLSGAGKTTVGRILRRMMKEREIEKNIILKDGDEYRDAMEYPRDYSVDGRRKLSQKSRRVHKMLVEQGISIVCCTISMYDEVRNWNRQNIKNYVEIYLEVPLGILKQRKKELYEGAEEGRVPNVVGINQAAEFPKHPDIHVLNDGTRTPEAIAAMIFEKIQRMGAISLGGTSKC